MKFSNVDPETASAVYDMLWQPAAAGPGGPKGSPLNSLLSFTTSNSFNFSPSSH